jgi:hypothetical protein
VHKAIEKAVLSSSFLKDLDLWAPMGGSHDPEMVARFLTAIEGGFIGGLGSGGGAHANARKRSNGTWIMKKAGGVPGNFANRMGVT